MNSNNASPELPAALLENGLNLQRYPLHDPDSESWQKLVSECREQLTQEGMFTLPGFFQPAVLDQLSAQLTPEIEQNSFSHTRQHNIYFSKPPAELPQNHPALRQFETSNHTLCADQLKDTALNALYNWPEFAEFLAKILGKQQLYTMADPLAAVNVMAYNDGEALNWHFDRAEFTTTLLIQTPEAGGEFEYMNNLRSDDNPNYDAVGQLLSGEENPKLLSLTAGSLNVFKGKNTAHRVTPVIGNRQRMIAVFSYFETPDVTFSEQDRLGFYGRKG